MIPELLELNLPDGPPEEIAFNLTAHKVINRVLQPRWHISSPLSAARRATGL